MTKTTHKTCCTNLSVPKTPAQLAALPYPSNQKKKGEPSSSLPNRLTNLHPPKPPFQQASPKIAKADHQRWWFPISPGTPLLDGSGDGIVRGYVQGCAELVTPYGVCLDASALKYLKRPKEMGKGPDPMACGLTWKVVLAASKSAPKVVPAYAKNATLGTGWIPIEAVVTADKDAGILKALNTWACCIDTYSSWGELLTKKGKPTTYKFRTCAQLDKVLGALAKGKANLKRYFKDGKKGRIDAILKVSGKQSILCTKLGVVQHCAPKINVLTDYLPRGADGKPGKIGGKNGYVNFNPHATWNAPIPIDTLPAGWTFSCVRFKKRGPVYSSIYEVPAKKGAVAGDPIGQAIGYYGYVDVDKQTKRAPGDKSKFPGRRYGWVPALALKKPGEKF